MIVLLEVKPNPDFPSTSYVTHTKHPTSKEVIKPEFILKPNPGFENIEIEDAGNHVCFFLNEFIIVKEIFNFYPSVAT